MKKLNLIYVLFLIVVCLCSCGGKKVSMDDFTVHDTVTKQEIKLGDMMDKVNQIFGKPDVHMGEIDLVYNYEDELTLYYDENNRVKTIVISFDTILDKDIDRYELKNGINAFSTVTDFLEKYPDAVDEDGRFKKLYIQEDGNKISFLPEYNKECDYGIELEYTSYANIERIYIRKY